MKLDPRTMNEVCKILYNNDGSDAVYALANELAEEGHNIGWSKCKECDADTPHIMTILTQCMVCSQYKKSKEEHGE